MSNLDCFYCGSLWCSGDNCGGRAIEDLRRRLALVTAERDRLRERVEAYAHLHARGQS